MADDIKGKSIRGATYTLAAQVGQGAIQFLSVVVLARLLTPEDYGLAGMAAIFTNFVFVFKDLGLSQAAVQKKNLSEEEASALFWINLAVALGLAGITCAIAPFAAGFYGDGRIAGIVLVSALGLALTGISAQHSAHLQRDMRMGALAFADVASRVVSFLTAAGCALAGFGYWSLVWCNVAGAAARSAVVWSAAKWRPRPAHPRHGLHCLKFGLNVAGFQIVNYFSRNADTMLVGKFLGTEATGLYNKAYRTMMLPVAYIRNPLNQVGTPALSRLQDEPERFRRYYSRLVGILAFLSLAPMAFFVVGAEEAVLVLFGERWTAATTVFALLSATALIQPILGSSGMMMLAWGKAREHLLYGIATAAATVAAAVVGLDGGIEGVACALLVANCALFVPTFVYATRGTPVKWHDVFSASWKPALGALCSSLAAWGVKSVLSGQAPMVRFAAMAAAAFVAYALYWAVVPGGRRDLLQLKEDFAGAFRKKKR